jgi:hypothetical protein
LCDQAKTSNSRRCAKAQSFLLIDSLKKGALVRWMARAGNSNIQGFKNIKNMEVWHEKKV